MKCWGLKNYYWLQGVEDYWGIIDNKFLDDYRVIADYKVLNDYRVIVDYKVWRTTEL